MTTSPVYGFNQFRERAERNRAAREDREQRALELIDARGSACSSELGTHLCPSPRNLQHATRARSQAKSVLERLEAAGQLVSTLEHEGPYRRRRYRRRPPATT